MFVTGLKLTHDAAVAVWHNDELLFSDELEKLANGQRYMAMPNLSMIQTILSRRGIRLEHVDRWVIDGWDGHRNHTWTIGGGNVVLAPYIEPDPLKESRLVPTVTGSLNIGGQQVQYESYPHVASHIASTYVTSPFADRKESSAVLVWDGGMFPRIYGISQGGKVTSFGPLFPLIGHAYAMAGAVLGPEHLSAASTKQEELNIAGKMMAYISLGAPQTDVLHVFERLYWEQLAGRTKQAEAYRASIHGIGSLAEASRAPTYEFLRTAQNELSSTPFTAADLLASFHMFVQQLLVGRLRQFMESEAARPFGGNLCLSGGCALNIKWNTAIRQIGAVKEMWIPPFPNDSGAALGSGALGRIQALSAGTWNLHSGPPLPEAPASLPNWSQKNCSPEELGFALWSCGRPIVVLHDNAELGPRALGGRSVLASATEPAMKAHLNKIKGREGYRPVAPMCLESDAPQIFDPGTPDPFMLFEHRVREAWFARVPAIAHLDGTARLQTVDPLSQTFLGKVLTAYKAVSGGIPVLCNTSANLAGRGFFPDVESAAEWHGTDYIWSNNKIYTRIGAPELSTSL